MAKDVKVFDWPSWGAYLADLRRIHPSARAGDAQWAGGSANIGQSLQLAATGWPEGISLVRQVSTPLADHIAATHVSDDGWGWDVTGADYDVGEYLSGTPECWLTPSAPTVRPMLNIAANIVSSATVPPAALKLRGAAVVALTLALQSRGFIVRVHAVQGSRVRDSDIWQRVVLSDDNGGPLDTDRLLFALAHPAASRQMGYVKSLVAGGGRTDGSEWIGWPSQREPPEEWGKPDVYLPGLFYTEADWHSADSVRAWVVGTYERVLAQLG